MSERSDTGTLTAMTLEEPGAEQGSPRAPGPLRCGPCAVWPRQQTWLCAVPLVMGFVGLGLSLMLLKWIVVGSVQDYVPTDLVDPKGSMGQDPIFLSKPSTAPKGPDIPSVDSLSTTMPPASDGAVSGPRTRFGPPANHSGNGSAANGADGERGTGRGPHLPNHVGTRVNGVGGGASSSTTTTTTSTSSSSTTSTRAPRGMAPPSGKEVRKNGNVGSGRNGPSISKSPGGIPGSTPPSATASSTTTTVRAASSAQPSVPAKPTSRWNPGRQAKGPATRPHHRYRTPVAPTLPNLRSEVFKPCVEDKDLAFCLNDGECSIIETVTGVHRHCRCKEGYHGLRCDQFVPKTDAILSDPTDELGIEFMESAETYQRQMLSILSISLGICLLAVACMALYRRNKGHREKLRSQFSESRSLRDCSIAPPGMLSKSSPRLQYGLQHQKGSHPRTSVVKGSGGAVPVSPSPLASPALARALAKAKRFRSSSLSISPAQERRGGTYCQTPPTSRGKCGLLDGARVTGRAYSHLDEAEVMDREAESLRRCVSAGLRVGGLLGRTSLSHFSSRRGWAEVPCTRLDKGNAFLPASLRTRSVPIIPSLQAHQPEEKGDVLDDSQPNVVVLVTPRGPFTPCETVVAATNGIPTTSSVQTPIVSMTMPGSVRNALSSPTLAAVTGSKHKTLPGPPAVVPWSQGQIYAASDATGCGRPRPLRTGRAPGLARLRGEDGLASQGRASWEHRAAGHGSATGGSRGDVGSGPHAS